MFKLDQDLFGQTLRAGDYAFDQHNDLRSLTDDIADLRQRIADQVMLIQELAWEAHDTAPAKKALHEMQDALRDWRAHRDLLLKLRGPSRNRPDVQALPAIIDA